MKEENVLTRENVVISGCKAEPPKVMSEDIRGTQEVRMEVGIRLSHKVSYAHMWRILPGVLDILNCFEVKTKFLV